MTDTEFVRRSSENGRLTLPKEVRELYGIQEGDFVRLRLVEVIRGPRLPARAAPADGANTGDGEA